MFCSKKLKKRGKKKIDLFQLLSISTFWATYRNGKITWEAFLSVTCAAPLAPSDP